MAVRKSSESKPLPSTEMENKEIQEPTKEKKNLPKVGAPENTVKIGNKLIEIKPTKLKYHRNRTAAFYRYLNVYPLPEILAMQEGAFGDDRDGDKALMDWLIAVVDDENLILANYDDMDTETVEKLLAIFKRVNKIDEKEEKLKNRMAQAKEA